MTKKIQFREHFASYDLCRKLQELGITQDTALFWGFMKLGDGDAEISLPAMNPVDRPYHFVEGQSCAAYTGAELGELIPKGFKTHKTIFAWDGTYEDGVTVKGWVCQHINGEIVPGDYFAGFGYTEANARARMLIHLLESKIVSCDKINNNFFNQQIHTRMHNTPITVGSKSYTVTYTWEDGKATPTSVTDAEGTEWLGEMKNNTEFQEQITALCEPTAEPTDADNPGPTDTGSC